MKNTEIRDINIKKRIIRSRAPLRVSFAGGGTDIPSWYQKYRGQVTSTTIDKYIYVTLTTNDTGKFKIIAFDLNKIVEFSVSDLDYNGEFDLVKAAYRNIQKLSKRARTVSEGYTIQIHSDLPAGSGMGTSSSLVVALIAAFAKLDGIHLEHRNIADLACKIEREELKQAGGYQDQFASTYGGFNFIEFNDNIDVHILQINQNFLDELNYRLILCYTGKTHVSAELQQTLINNYQTTDQTEGMFALMKYAEDLRNLLVKSDLSTIDEFGKILHESWVVKQSLNEKISNEEIERLYQFSIKNGAIGGKLLGAGGGGFLLLFAKPLERMELINKLTHIGAEIVPFRFEKTGIVAWEVVESNKK
jgi:D-glycero-alpha-D-manno-heptose-7-phosphate kinase